MNFKIILCKILGHKFKVIKEYSPVERKVGCSRRGHMWGMHDEAKAFIPWGWELEYLHKRFDRAEGEAGNE